MENQEKKEKSCGKKERNTSVQCQPHESQPSANATVPPPAEHVKIYFEEKGYPLVEAEKFYNYFQSNGWLVGGRAKMKDWKAAARNWMLNIPKFAPQHKSPNPSHHNLNITKKYDEPL